MLESKNTHFNEAIIRGTCTAESMHTMNVFIEEKANCFLSFPPANDGMWHIDIGWHEANLSISENMRGQY